MIVEIRDEAITGLWNLLKKESTERYNAWKAAGITDEEAVNFMVRGFFQLARDEYLENVRSGRAQFKVSECREAEATDDKEREIARQYMRVCRSSAASALEKVGEAEKVLSKYSIPSIDDLDRGSDE